MWSRGVIALGTFSTGLALSLWKPASAVAPGPAYKAQPAHKLASTALFCPSHEFPALSQFTLPGLGNLVPLLLYNCLRSSIVSASKNFGALPEHQNLPRTLGLHPAQVPGTTPPVTLGGLAWSLGAGGWRGEQRGTGEEKEWVRMDTEDNVGAR